MGKRYVILMIKAMEKRHYTESRAWSVENRLVLAQVAVDQKSNEITAIPELLRQLSLSGCIVTIDAMGTQKQITKQIVDDDGDFVLALKNNHKKLRKGVEQVFANALEGSSPQIPVYSYAHSG